MTQANHPRAAWRGATTCVRAAAMLTGMVALLVIQGHANIANGITLAQGSYQPWSKYSANTHAGCGVVDISRFNSTTGRLWTQAEWALIVAAARQVGFAAWHRFAIKDLWVEHTHCVAIGCPDLNIPDATNQVAWYRSGQDGLAGHGPDNGPRDWVNVTWETHQTHGDVPAPANAPLPAAPTQEDSMVILGGIGLPAYIVSSAGAVCHLNAEHLEIGIALAAGQTSHLSTVELELAKDIINTLRENKGF